MNFSILALFALLSLISVIINSISATTIEIDTLASHNDFEQEPASLATTQPPMATTHHHHLPHFMPSIVSVSYCDGIRCSTNCKTQRIITGRCYHDLSTGKHIRFACGTPSTNSSCWQGYAFDKPGCKRFSEIGRNSMMCNSCTGDKVFDCTLTNAVLEKSNCTNCQNCTKATRFPIGKCQKMPGNYSSGVEYGEISKFGSCGSGAVVKTVYSSWFGCYGSATRRPYQIGYPTAFCAAGRNTSRIWGCHKPVPRTTTAAPALSSSSASVEEIQQAEQLNKNGIPTIRLPLDEEEGSF